uniref:Uncharacterized protein n=1 Tax=viral metagenome TaxID=1070528 RepID=A0A6M3MGR2_9ZZZZ
MVDLMEFREKVACPSCGAGGKETHEKMFVGTEWVIRLHVEDGEVTSAQCKNCYHEGKIDEFLIPDE